MNTNIFAGIDIGGTKISAALVTPAGKIINRAKVSTPKNASAGEIFDIICDLTHEKLLSDSSPKHRLKGIGIGVPGIVNNEGVVVRTPNMNLSGVNIEKKLKRRFKTKIQVGNDVNLGLLGEKWLGCAKNAKNVIGLFLGTGLGGAIIINNQLITGSHGAAAEIGHMIIEEDGPKCTCGNKGCLEAFVGRWAIERDIKNALNDGEKSIIKKIIPGKIKRIKSKILRKTLRKWDPLVTDIMSEASRHLGKACITLRHLYDPDLIVFGGGVIYACGEFMLPIINKTFQNDPLFSSLAKCPIKQSHLGDDAVILGGVSLVRS